MASYQNLPVYKESYDLLLYVYVVSRNFQRDYRYTLGESLKHEALDSMINIYKASLSSLKLPLIEVAFENIESIKIQVRLLYDLKQLSLKQYTKLSIDIVSISKQLATWKKYEYKKIKTNTFA